MGPITQVHTFCRICPASCGLVVDVEGDRVVRVSGDPEHPISQGYTCSKGRSLPAQHHDPGRLDHPQLRGSETSWSGLLDDLAGTLNALVAADGPRAIALYQSAGSGFDTLGRYMVDAFRRGLGTSQVYSPVTIDTPNKLLVPELVAGTPYLTPQPDRDRAELVLLIGQNPAVSHGHGMSWPNALADLRAMRGRGAKVVVVDPRVTETVRAADLHVQLLPGSDAALLAHLVRHVLAHRPDADYLATCAEPASVGALARAVEPYDRATTAARCGVGEAVLVELTELVSRSQRLSATSGTGTSMGSTANVSEWLAWALNAVTGSLDRAGGTVFNPGFLRPQEMGVDARPRWGGEPATSRPWVRPTFGELPCTVLADEIIDGPVRALLAVGGNPVRVFPDTAKITAALRSLDALAIIEIRRTETTAIATHVMPCAGQLERPDLPGLFDTAFPVPFTQFGRRVVPPAAERKPTWWIMHQLGQRMGLHMPDPPADGDEEAFLAQRARRARVDRETLMAARSGLTAPSAPEPGWLVPERLPRGRLDLAPVELVGQLAAWDAHGALGTGLRLINRRLPHQLNSALTDISTQLRSPHPTLLVNDRDAETLGLKDGDPAVVSSRHGSTTATIERSHLVRPGVVSLPHGWGEPNVNDLTSDVEDLDPITGMPLFSGIEVTVAAQGA